MEVVLVYRLYVIRTSIKILVITRRLSHGLIIFIIGISVTGKIALIFQQVSSYLWCIKVKCYPIQCEWRSGMSHEIHSYQGWLNTQINLA